MHLCKLHIMWGHGTTFYILISASDFQYPSLEKNPRTVSSLSLHSEGLRALMGLV